jgi:hypothetical protein
LVVFTHQAAVRDGSQVKRSLPQWFEVGSLWLVSTNRGSTREFNIAAEGLKPLQHRYNLVTPLSASRLIMTKMDP